MNKIKSIAFLCYEANVGICVKLNRICKNKWKKALAYSFCIPLMLITWSAKSLYELCIAKKRVSRFIYQDNNKYFQDEVAVVAIAKNEATYIREWIAYYKVIGVNRIYLYDNESIDGLKECISDFIQEGFVVYTYFPGKNRQMDAYNDAIKRYKGCARYMAFVDCDEFIVSTSEEELPTTIRNMMIKNPNAAGLGINWALYGSSGYERKKRGLVTEIFLNRAGDQAWPNYHIKTIVNPRLVKNYISPHFPVYFIGAWSIDSNGKRQRLWYNHDVDYSEIRCNHYFCKSKEEFIIKQNRGMADRQEYYDFSKFDEYDLNDVFDDIMLRYTSRIHALLNDK